MDTKKIIVIGAGITGVATAEWLRRDGHHVLLIDRLNPGSPDQTSFGNAGLLAKTSIVPIASPSMVRKAPLMLLAKNAPLYLRWSYLPRLMPWLLPFLRNATESRFEMITKGLVELLLDTNEQHLALAQGTPAQKLIARGSLISLYRTKRDFEKDNETNKILRDNGIIPEHLNRETLIERDPFLGPDYTFAAQYGDYCWIRSPGAYVKALFDHFCAQSGTFRQSAVVDVKAGPTPSVTLEGGKELWADKLVIASGAWSTHLANQAGARVIMDTERGYHIAYFKPNIMPQNPYMVTDGKFAVTPMDGFLRAAGTVEFGGLDAAPSAAPIAFIERAMKRLYPTLRFEHQKTWMGRRPTTPDSLPVLGESQRTPNVLHAYGGQHVGLTIGAKLGRLTADLIAARRPNINLEAFQPDRF